MVLWFDIYMGRFGLHHDLISRRIAVKLSDKSKVILMEKSVLKHGYDEGKTCR